MLRFISANHLSVTKST